MSKHATHLSHATFTDEQMANLARYEAELANHMIALKPRRYAHSLSVARVAEGLAVLYDVDPYLAHVAGILHDWHKVYSNKQQIEQAQRWGIDMGVDPVLVANLLHGKIAAKELPSRFPELPSSVWQAIDRHTTAAFDMTPLDKVLFVADGIEPQRPANPELDQLRALVGSSTLDELYWESFVSGVVYVLSTKRYLYPGTLDIYNQGILERTGI